MFFLPYLIQKCTWYIIRCRGVVGAGTVVLYVINFHCILYGIPCTIVQCIYISI